MTSWSRWTLQARSPWTSCAMHWRRGRRQAWLSPTWWKPRRQPVPQRLREFAYEVALPADRREDAANRVAHLLAQPTLPVGRADAPAVDLRDLLVAADITAGRLRFRIRTSRERNLRARDVLAALGLHDLREHGVYPRPHPGGVGIMNNSSARSTANRREQRQPTEACR